MGDVISFSDEQFDKLLTAIAAKQTPGLGQPAAPNGLGCGDLGMGCLSRGVYEMLELGSPRLALARALGVRLTPYYFNIRATFADVSTTNVPDVGADVKIVTDTLVDSVLVRIFNQSTTANQSQFQAETDFYYTFQSGIEATLDVKGAPRPTLAPKFTPLASLADAFNGDAHYPHGFILTYQQQLQASFNATITLPYAPLQVVLTFRAFTTDSEKFTMMTNEQAFRGLLECGLECSEAYMQRVLSVCR